MSLKIASIISAILIIVVAFAGMLSGRSADRTFGMLMIGAALVALVVSFAAPDRLAKFAQWALIAPIVLTFAYGFLSGLWQKL